MKDRLPLNEDMEVMLTSYLLGELGDSDVRKVEQALKENPDLQTVANELEASIAVLRQVASSESVENHKDKLVPQKLNTERRNQLLNTLREHDSHRKNNIRQLPWFIPMGIAAGLIALLSAYSFVLQTQSPMRGAVDAAESIIASSGATKIEPLDLFNQSLSTVEALGRRQESETVHHYFVAPSSESTRYRSKKVNAPTEERVEVKKNSSTAMRYALKNDFIDPQVTEESKLRGLAESGKQSVARNYFRFQEQAAPPESAPSFGRASRRKVVQQFESKLSKSEAIDEDNTTLLGSIDTVKKEQTELDLVESLSDDISSGNSVKLQSLPAISSFYNSSQAQEVDSISQPDPLTGLAWGIPEDIDAKQPAPKKAKGLEELSKQRRVQTWAYQQPESEALFDSETTSLKTQVDGFQIESDEKNVDSTDTTVVAGARFGLNRGSSASKDSKQSDFGSGGITAEDVQVPDVTHRLFAKVPDTSVSFESEPPSVNLADDFDNYANSMAGFGGMENKGGGLGGGGGGIASNTLSAGTLLSVQNEEFNAGIDEDGLGLIADNSRKLERKTDLGFDVGQTYFDAGGTSAVEERYDEFESSRYESFGANFAKPTSGLRDSGIETRESEARSLGDKLSYGFQSEATDFAIARPSIIAGLDSAQMIDKAKEISGETTRQGLARGRGGRFEQLGESSSDKSFQQESPSASPSLGKVVDTRAAGNFGDVMKRLDDISGAEELAAYVEFDDKIEREEQVMLRRLGENVLSQLQEGVITQPAVPAQIELALPKLSATPNSEIKFSDGSDATALSRIPSPSQPENKSRPVAASNVDHHPEFETSKKSTSTFSLNVSDVSFKLAKAALSEGQLPDPKSVRSEQFLNAFDYRDPAPYSNQPIGFHAEQVQHPFAHHRDVVRFSIQTAATGRTSDRPMHLTILLDNSGSMERNDRREILSQALNVLSQQLTPKDKISVVSFARTARLWVDGAEGGSPVSLLDKVNNLTPQGGTNIEDALNAAYEVASDHYIENGINRVVLLTDGAANLGNVEPDELKERVVAERKRGIAFDCFGIGWDGLNDPLLEVLSRNGDGRYGFLNNAADASIEFADQLAGALNVAASDVKVQVEFNPERVKHWRQIGYAKHQLAKEDFRDNTVDAAEIAAAESGNALYVFEPLESGSGPIGQVRVRYRIPHSSTYQEKEWTVPFKSSIPSPENSSGAMKLALASGLFAEWLNGNPHAGDVSIESLQKLYQGVPETFGKDPRPYELEQMFEQARSISGL